MSKHTDNESAEDRKTTEIPSDLHAAFKSEAALRGMTLLDANKEAIRLWIKSKPAQRRRQLQPA